MPLSTYFSFLSTFDDVLEALYLISNKESPFLQSVRFSLFFLGECLMWPLTRGLGPKKLSIETLPLSQRS